MYKSAHSSSRVSRDGSLSTPFAPRPFKARPLVKTDYPAALAREMATRRQYYSLSDPHLTHYFRAKLASGLSWPASSRASSSLSYRSHSSEWPVPVLTCIQMLHGSVAQDVAVFQCSNFY